MSDLSNLGRVADSRESRFDEHPGGKVVVEGGPGDFLRVPAGAIHRESNPAANLPLEGEGYPVNRVSLRLWPESA
jgi:hypothetical protein